MKTPQEIATAASAGRARMAIQASARAGRTPCNIWKLKDTDVTRLLMELRDLCDAEGIAFEAAVYDSAPPIKQEASHG